MCVDPQFTEALVAEPFWTPDGQKLAFIVKREDQTDIWQFTVPDQSLHRLTYGWEGELTVDHQLILYSHYTAGMFKDWDKATAPGSITTHRLSGWLRLYQEVFPQ